MSPFDTSGRSRAGLDVDFDLLVTPGLDSRPGLMDLQFAVQAWTGACTALGVPDRADTLSDLYRRYAEPGRRYHDRSHLSEVVVEVCNLAGDLSLDRVQRAVAVFAAFFHDAVYEPGAPDNEVRSGDLAREALHDAGMPRHLIDRVVRAILATAAHQSDDLEAQVLVDADLAILAADQFTYDLYCASLRAESLGLTDSQWAAMRCRTVERLLGRPTIFLTDAKAEAEPRARANLTHELARLRLD